MKTIAIMNNKGGVGKTVTAVNLADILVRHYRKRVLLVDCDGQMNLTSFFLPEFDPEVNLSLADVLGGSREHAWRDNLMPIQPGLDLLTGSSGLYDLDFRALNEEEYGLTGGILGVFLDDVARDGEVDYVICDCPPGYTLASVNALLASDEVVVPMLLDGFSFTGMMDLQGQLRSLRSSNGSDKLAGVLLTQWHNSEVVRQGEALVREQVGAPVFRTVIRRTDKVPESTFVRQPITLYSPTSAAARDYLAWVREYIGPPPELDLEVR